MSWRKPPRSGRARRADPKRSARWVTSTSSALGPAGGGRLGKGEAGSPPQRLSLRTRFGKVGHLRPWACVRLPHRFRQSAASALELGTLSFAIERIRGGASCLDSAWAPVSTQCRVRFPRSADLGVRGRGRAARQRTIDGRPTDRAYDAGCTCQQQHRQGIRPIKQVRRFTAAG
jgi:hypothetical protein